MSIRGDATRSAREASFSVFFAEHWSSVRHRIEVLLEDDDQPSDDVDELVSEVFLLAWKKWDRPRRITLAWLHVVIDNKLRDRRRRRRVREKAMDVVQQALVPNASALDELDRIAVRNALGRLTEREREALTLSYWGGWSAEEIAERLGSTPSAVWVMLSRARMKVRSGIAESDPEPVR